MQGKSNAGSEPALWVDSECARLRRELAWAEATVHRVWRALEPFTQVDKPLYGSPTSGEIADRLTDLRGLRYHLLKLSCELDREHEASLTGAA
jgi:hypothetical protein